MPTPRAHGGAALNYRPINLPGFRGLNTQASGALLGPEWATRLENTIIDSENRIQSRKGFSGQGAVLVTGVTFLQLHENENNGDLYAVGDDDKLYRSTDVGGNWTDDASAYTLGGRIYFSK